jgi:predicted dehydrogenase
VQHPTWQLADTGETIDVDAPDTVLLNGVLANGAVVSFHAGSVPHHGSGWRMEAHGTAGTLVAATPVMPQISPVTLTGAQGGAPLGELDVVDEPGVALPDGPARNVAHAYAQLARAIRTGTPFHPDFAHAVGVHRLLDDIRASSDTGSKIRRTAAA